MSLLFLKCKIDDLEQITADKKLSLNQRLKNLRNEFDKEHYKSQMKNGNVVSAQFDPTIQYMYEGVGDLKHYPMGPLTNNLRGVLVDNILNNVTFLNDQEVLKFRTEQKIKDLILKNKKIYENGGETDPLITEDFYHPPSTSDNKIENSKKGMFFL